MGLGLCVAQVFYLSSDAFAGLYDKLIKRGTCSAGDGKTRSMIGVVLVSHNSLSTAFKAAVEHVVGPQVQFDGICIEADDDMEQRRNEIIEAVAAVDSGDGVIIVTDMFGGTPSNLAISLMQPGKVEILAGMNLPMLIKLAKARETQAIERVLSLAAEAGRKYINIASQVLAADP